MSHAIVVIEIKEPQRQNNFRREYIYQDVST